MWFFIFCCYFFPARSYDTSSRRKPADRSKRSHHRRSPTSSRHGHRQRHREERDDRSQSVGSRRRHRDRVVKDRSPVKVKPNQYFPISHLLHWSVLSCVQFLWWFWRTTIEHIQIFKNTLHFILYILLTQTNWTNYRQIFFFIIKSNELFEKAKKNFNFFSFLRPKRNPALFINAIVRNWVCVVGLLKGLYLRWILLCYSDICLKQQFIYN